MAPYSSTFAWKIPRSEEPGRLQSIGSLRVGHDWATSLSLFTFMHWRRKWQPHSSVLAWRIPGTGEPGGLHLWGCTESDTTEVTQQQQQQFVILKNCQQLKCSPIAEELNKLWHIHTMQHKKECQRSIYIDVEIF